MVRVKLQHQEPFKARNSQVIDLRTSSKMNPAMENNYPGRSRIDKVKTHIFCFPWIKAFLTISSISISSSLLLLFFIFLLFVRRICFCAVNHWLRTLIIAVSKSLKSSGLRWLRKISVDFGYFCLTIWEITDRLGWIIRIFISQEEIGYFDRLVSLQISLHS